MRIQIRSLLLCLLAAVVCFFGRRRGAPGDTAGLTEVAPAGRMSGPPIAESHQPPRRVATSGIQNLRPENVFERTPGAAVEVDWNREPEVEVLDEFDRWLEEYCTMKSLLDKRALDREGESLALARRTVLAGLVKSDPELALRRAVPMVIRQELPASIAQHLEERVSGLARYDVLAFLETPGQQQPNAAIERFVTVNSRTFKAFVYGRRVLQTSKAAIPLHGIAVGNALAVHESPVRALEPGESPDSSFPVANADGRCPISEQAASPAVSVEVGGEIVYLCHAGHIQAFNHEIEAREAGIGPAPRASVVLPGAATWTQGPKSVLFMRVSFPDDSEESISAGQADEMMRQVNQFFIANSHGVTSLATSVTPVLTLRAAKAWYASNNAYATLLEDARAAAAAAGFNTRDFDLDCVHLKPVFSSSLGYVGAKGAWLQSRSPATACHELGHNFGLWHANSWKTSDGSVIGAGNNREYGNAFDTMGSGVLESWEFNACHKNILGWLPNDAVETITSNGVYRLHAFDVPSLEDGLTYALKIPRDAQRNYWIETRQALAINPAFSGSVLINWSPWIGSDGGTQLLDTTPGSDGGVFDAPLLLGRPFYDPSIGLKIVARNLGGTIPESIDVRVTRVHYLAVEAEEGVLLPPTRVLDDPLASQHECLASPLPNQGGALWTLDVPATGDYAVWCRVRRDQSGEVPLSVSVDGESEPVNAMVEAAGSSEWLWCRLIQWPQQTSAGPTPKLLALTAGTHTVRLTGGEHNSRLDCLLFTDDPATKLPPIISPIADQVTVAGPAGISIPFTVFGVGTPSSDLRLGSRSSDSTLIPESNIVFGGDGINRTVAITPAADRLGKAAVTLQATDPDGNQVARTFSLTVIGAVQARVNLASPGDTVVIPAGTYTDRVVIDKDISLQGAGAVDTVIDGWNLGVPLTIMSNATVTIRNLTLRRGSAGGLRNFGSATLDGCTISDNFSSTGGGGIRNGPSAWLLLRNCTVSSNRSLGSDGGGIYNAGILTGHTITVSGNRATNKDDKGNGGGIYNTKVLELHNGTITGNRAAHRGGGLANFGAATLHSTIVARNSVLTGAGADCDGALISAGYNLFQDPDGFTLSGEVEGNVVGQDPRLGPLQDNGGPTPTHALLPGSPAIDRGRIGGRAVDQRGVNRPLDAPGVANAADACDIGAYEWIPEGLRELRASLTTGPTAATLAMRFVLAAQGDENSIEFSFVYPSAFLNDPHVTLGKSARDAALAVSVGPDGAGRMSVRVTLPAGRTFSPGAHDLVVIEFDSALESTARNISEVGFDLMGGNCAIQNVAGDELFTVYRVTSSSIRIPPRLAVRRLPNGDVFVCLIGGSGNTWTIQASSDFATWRTVTTIAMAARTAEVNDPSAHQYACLFYRAFAE